MSKRATLKTRGLDAVFHTGKDSSKTERQKASTPGSPNTIKTVSRNKKAKQGKVKQTYYIAEGTSLLLDELRLQLRREHDLPLSKTSKSAIVQVAVELQAKNISQLARQLAKG